MNDLITLIVGITGLFVILSGASYFLQSGMKKNGFFTTPPPISVKVTAFLIGLLFAGFFLLEFMFDSTRHLLLPILALLLFVYGFYGERLINAWENRRRK